MLTPCELSWTEQLLQQVAAALAIQGIWGSLHAPHETATRDWKYVTYVVVGWGLGSSVGMAAMYKSHLDFCCLQWGGVGAKFISTESV